MSKIFLKIFYIFVTIKCISFHAEYRLMELYAITTFSDCSNWVVLTCTLSIEVFEMKQKSGILSINGLSTKWYYHLFLRVLQLCISFWESTTITHTKSRQMPLERKPSTFSNLRYLSWIWEVLYLQPTYWYIPWVVCLCTCSGVQEYA